MYIHLSNAVLYFASLQHRLSEWLQETGQEVQRPLSIKTDLSDVDSEEAEFIKCVPSPHANSLSHLRRNSVSTGRDNQGKAVGSVTLQLDNNIGSAKKVNKLVNW